MTSAETLSADTLSLASITDFQSTASLDSMSVLRYKVAVSAEMYGKMLAASFEIILALVITSFTSEDSISVLR